MTKSGSQWKSTLCWMLTWIIVTCIVQKNIWEISTNKPNHQPQKASFYKNMSKAITICKEGSSSIGLSKVYAVTWRHYKIKSRNPVEGSAYIVQQFVLHLTLFLSTLTDGRKIWRYIEAYILVILSIIYYQRYKWCQRYYLD